MPTASALGGGVGGGGGGGGGGGASSSTALVGAPAQAGPPPMWRGDESDLWLGRDSSGDSSGGGVGGPPRCVMLAEYIEEHPPLLNRPGMASRVLSYARRTPGVRIPPPAVGERRWIESDDELPFAFGAALPASCEVSAMHTNLTTAPVVAHAVRRTQFLLVVSTTTHADGTVVKTATLRPVHHLVAVGQQQPVTQANQEVPAVPRPHSKEFKELLFRRISFIIQQRLFGEPGGDGPRVALPVEYARVMLGWHGREARRHYPRMREALEHMADKMTADGPHRGKWAPREGARLNATQRDLFLTPEEVVILDAALEGEERLQSRHIKRLTDGRDLSKHFDKLTGDVETRVRHKAIAVSIADELALTPWALTTNFLDARHGRCRLALAGIADPTGIGAGFSYTRMRIRDVTTDEKKRGKGWRRPAGGAGGTANGADDFDLRRTSKERMVQWLSREGGESLEHVKRLSRADCMALVRSKRTGAGDDDDDDERGVVGAAAANMHLPTAEELAALGKDIWKSHLALLATGANRGSTGGDGDDGAAAGDDDDDDDDDDDFEAELEKAMEANKPRGPDLSSDARDLEKLREERAERAEQGERASTAAAVGSSGAGGGSSTDLGGDGCPPGKRRITRQVQVKVLVETRWEVNKKSGTFRKDVIEHKDEKRIKEYENRLRADAQREQKLQTDVEKTRQKEEAARAKKLEKTEGELLGRQKAIGVIKARKDRGIFVAPNVSDQALSIHCSACGEYGHNKSSRECPLYEVKDTNVVVPDQGFRDGTVKQDHRGGQIKFTINNELLKEKVGDAPALDPRLQKLNLKLYKTDHYQETEARRDFEKSVLRKGRGGDARSERIGRKAGSPRVKLNELLAKIISPLITDSKFSDFVEDPSNYYGISLYHRAIAPNEPMFLKAVLVKCEKQRYDSSAELVANVALIKQNCVRFNAEPTINDQVRELLKGVMQGADRLIERVNAELGKHADAIRVFDDALQAEKNAPPIQRLAKSGGSRGGGARARLAGEAARGGTSTAAAGGGLKLTPPRRTGGGTSSTGGSSRREEPSALTPGTGASQGRSVSPVCSEFSVDEMSEMDGDGAGSEGGDAAESSEAVDSGDDASSNFGGWTDSEAGVESDAGSDGVDSDTESDFGGVRANVGASGAAGAAAADDDDDDLEMELMAQLETQP